QEYIRGSFFLTVEYDDERDQLVTSPPHGDPPSHIEVQVHEIKFNHPDEYLQQIEGVTGPIDGVGSDLVTSITFKTNHKTYGPYGKPGAGTHFSSGIGKIVGFWGNSGWALDKIGVHVQVAPVQIQGPWGGPGGDPFDDGVATRIRGFKLMTASKWRTCTSPPHGNPPAVVNPQVDEVNFNYPYEYLQQIEGLTGAIEGIGSNLVTSITFKTNVKTYGPYGKPGGGTPFKSGIGNVVGFWGSSGWALDRIGKYISNYGPYGNPGGRTPFKSGIGKILNFWGSSGYALDRLAIRIAEFA
ncbi:hypothetical protein CY35_15G087400, partial [Sphagnum magellanicum]